MATLSLNLAMLKVTLHVIDNQGCVRTKPLIPNPLALLLVFLILDQISLLEVLPSNKLATGLDHPMFSVDLRWMQISTAFQKKYPCQLMVDLKSKTSSFPAT